MRIVRMLLVSAVFGSGCYSVCGEVDDSKDVDVDTACDEQNWYQDADGDGYVASSENPVAACEAPDDGYVTQDELGGWLTDDCDDTDDTVGSGKGYSIDADGDGYGTGLVVDMIIVCDGDEVPEGYAHPGDDCDDTNAAINFDAKEVCDGVDNDCDELIDDEDPSVSDQQGWYQDADGDLWGNPQGDTMVWVCDGDEVPEGYTMVSGDCDDTNAAINPGAEEVCDGVDNNCYNGINDEVCE